MNLRQVEVFRVVMTNGTTARAAEVLHVSQPAVSKMIQELERSLGFDLFRRIKGRLHPTPEGQLFFREVEHAFLGLGHLRGAAARIRDFGSGELKIACLSALSTNVLPRALHAFMARNPNVAVTFQARMSSTVRDLVASGQFDLGVGADEIDRTGGVAADFARCRVAVAVPEGHPLQSHETLHPRDLADYPFIALAPEDTTRSEAEAAFEKVGVKVRNESTRAWAPVARHAAADAATMGSANALVFANCRRADRTAAAISHASTATPAIPVPASTSIYELLACTRASHAASPR